MAEDEEEIVKGYRVSRNHTLTTVDLKIQMLAQRVATLTVVLYDFPQLILTIAGIVP